MTNPCCWAELWSNSYCSEHSNRDRCHQLPSSELLPPRTPTPPTAPLTPPRLPLRHCHCRRRRRHFLHSHWHPGRSQWLPREPNVDPARGGQTRQYGCFCRIRRRWIWCFLLACNEWNFQAAEIRIGSVWCSEKYFVSPVSTKLLPTSRPSLPSNCSYLHSKAALPPHS